jgi:hypothetical protein
MRGVVTLAAALSLPVTLPGRDLVLVSAFAVILVTVLLQGTTLGPLIRLMGLTGPHEEILRQKSEDLAWKAMTEAQYKAIANLSRQPDGSDRHPRLLEQYGYRLALRRNTRQTERHTSRSKWSISTSCWQRSMPLVLRCCVCIEPVRFTIGC